ncbi:hypothetical protein C0J52_15187, partial [Blattella germanica]
KHGWSRKQTTRSCDCYVVHHLWQLLTLLRRFLINIIVFDTINYRIKQRLSNSMLHSLITFHILYIFVFLTG